MIRRDHLLKAVQQLVDAVARVLFLKRNAQHEQALWTIDQAFQVVFSLTAEQVRALSLDDLIAVGAQEIDPLGRKLLLLGDLLKEQADLLALQNKPADSHTSKVQALALYLEALTGKHCAVSTEAVASLENLIDQCAGQRLPGPVYRRLIHYFELRGNYADAEDRLFDWLESGEPGAEPEGSKFYQRLAEKDDADLTNGDLPRAEVEEGRREFERRVSNLPATGLRGYI